MSNPRIRTVSVLDQPATGTKEMTLGSARTRNSPGQTAVLVHAVEQLPQPIMITGCDGTIEYVNRAFEVQTGYPRAEILNKQPSILKSGHHDDEFYRRLWTTILDGKIFRGVLVNRRRDATLIRQSLSITPLIGDRGKTIGFVAVGEEAAVASSTRLELLRQMRAFRALAATLPGFVYQLKPRPNAKTGAECDYVVLHSTGGKAFGDGVFPTQAFLRPEDRQTRRRQIEEAIERGKPFACEYSIQAAGGDERHFLECGLPLLDLEGRTSRIYCVVIDITHHALLQLAAQRSGTPVGEVSAQLLAQHESERKRIARELHDGIGQILMSIKMQVEAACAVVSQSGFPAGALALQAIVPTIQNAMQEVRSISKDLRPPILDDLGIIATIAWFSRNFSKTFEGIRVEVDLRVSEASVPGALKTVIYRVIQEAMNNVAKHAGATLARIRLRNASTGLELIIEDNGRGLELPQMIAGSHGGIGLASMRERVKMSGGEFWIQSTPGVGTIVRATWPRGRATGDAGDDTVPIVVH